MPHCSPDCVCLSADFASAPNLTAAAAAQNLTWAPVSLAFVTVDSYTLVMITSNSALLTLSLSAELGVSGDITDVAPSGAASGSRRRLHSSSSNAFWPTWLLNRLLLTHTVALSNTCKATSACTCIQAVF